MDTTVELLRFKNSENCNLYYTIHITNKQVHHVQQNGGGILSMPPPFFRGISRRDAYRTRSDFRSAPAVIAPNRATNRPTSTTTPASLADTGAAGATAMSSTVLVTRSMRQAPFSSTRL